MPDAARADLSDREQKTALECIQYVVNAVGMHFVQPVSDSDGIGVLA